VREEEEEEEQEVEHLPVASELMELVAVGVGEVVRLGQREIQEEVGVVPGSIRGMIGWLVYCQEGKERRDQ
jgi:hypothetical protein